MSSLENLQVYGETSVGWDRNTPVNETVDDEGNPTFNFRFGQADPRAPKNRVYDDPEVEALRQELKAHNGFPELEICSPKEVERAAFIFHRDGFVVVRDVLTAQQLEQFRAASAEVLEAILVHKGPGNRQYVTETFRLPHRYSFGTASASRQMLHHPVWANMIDLPTTTPILKKIFATDDYKVWGCGGDLCLPGAVEYQHLHADIHEDFDVPEGRAEHARRLGIHVPDELDAKTRQQIVEMAPGFVTINFLMSDLNWENGPIRQIPGTHGLATPPPTPAEEPAWMRHSTLVGATAGSCVIRDNRAWHGATPNLSREVRALPNIEYVSDWFPQRAIVRNMPYEVWQNLPTEHAKTIAKDVCAEPGVWPAGAGVMHPTASARKEAYQADKERTE